MAQAGQFGLRYTQVIDRLFHALEWRYNEVKDKKGHAREAEIISKLLDVLLADQVGHDLPLHDVEAALQSFQRVRHDSFTPTKYNDIIALMGLSETETIGYKPHLFGNVTLDTYNNQ